MKEKRNVSIVQFKKVITPHPTPATNNINGRNKNQ